MLLKNNVLLKISDKLLNIARFVIATIPYKNYKGKVATGELLNSLNVRVLVLNEGRVSIELYAAPQAEYVINGREAFGKNRPDKLIPMSDPASAFRKWGKAKGFSDSILYAIRQKINEEGIPPTPIDVEIAKEFFLQSDFVLESLTTQFFNELRTI